MFEETTRTLFTGNLYTQLGDGPALSVQRIAETAIAAEEGFHVTALTPTTAATIGALKAYQPERLAVMHGSCFIGDCDGELETHAACFESRLKSGQTP